MPYGAIPSVPVKTPDQQALRCRHCARPGGGCSPVEGTCPPHPDLPQGVLFKAALWAYVLPLMTTFLAAFSAQWIGLDDAHSALCALGGLFAGFIVLRFCPGLSSKAHSKTPCQAHRNHAQ
jgi:hypothetical protein